MFEIAGWFSAIDESDPGDTNLGEIIDIVFTLLKTCHPKLLGEYRLETDLQLSAVKIEGRFFSAIFDVLYILIQNIAEHCELSAEESECLISFRSQEGSNQLRISNRVRDLENIDRQVVYANSLIHESRTGGEGEGRSGLRKVNRILSKSMGAEACISDISRQGDSFSIQIAFPVKGHQI